MEEQQQPTTTLMNLSVAIRALARAKEPDEVGQIRDKAEAIRAYLKRQGMALDAQNDAAEVKLRADRRLAEILEEIDRQGVGRPVAGSNLPTMGELNIGSTELSRWRLEATVPEREFCGWLAETRAKNAEITTSALLRFARGYGGSAEVGGSTTGTRFVAFSFQVPQDGAEVVRAAMVEAAKITGVSHPGVNLVGICQDFLSGILPAAEPNPPDFNDF